MDTNSSRSERIAQRPVIASIGAALGVAGLSLAFRTQGAAKQNANKKRRKKDAKSCHQSCDLLTELRFEPDAPGDGCWSDVR